MRDNIRVNGWDFEYVENDYDDKFYQCRGEVMYDDEHDQIPEPSLWQAAEKTREYISRRWYKILCRTFRKRLG